MKKKALSALVATCLLSAGGFLLASCSNPELDATIAIEQAGQDQSISVTWDSKEKVDKAEIIVKHGDDVVTSKTITDTEELSDNQVDVYAYYGKHDVSVKLYKGNQTKAKEETVKVFTDEYNIAPISGSMPVLLFTLQTINGNITVDKGAPGLDTDDKAIPTFTWLARSGSWNWNKLPENVYSMPTVSMDEILTHNNYDKMIQTTDAYIEELYSINKNSKFNLFLNDYNAYQYFHLLVANGIDESNYTCTFLSDGAFSYSIINNTFNVENATALYNEMKTTYFAEKAKAANGEKFNLDLRKQLLVMANEDANVEWWFPRLRADHISLTNDTSGLTQSKIFSSGSTLASSHIKEKSIASDLTAIQASAEKTAQLKDLYKFNDDMFEKANKENKKVMMLLGSWATTEDSFEDYANFVKKYYGDEYVYYYKGHPNTPTDLYPAKAEQLEQLGLIDVESTINAELILFFFPDIYMSGYSSSTFTSLQDEEMACAFWGQTKAQAVAIANQNGDMFDTYVSKPVAHGTTYDAYLVEGHTCYVVEYNDTTDYDFGIYDATENEIINYKGGVVVE